MRAPKVFTYFDAGASPPGVGEMIRLWVVSWQRQGWEPRILARSDAMAHQRYARSDKKPRTLRWLALQHAGSGLFASPEVINYGMRPTRFGRSCLLLHPEGSLAWMPKGIDLLAVGSMAVRRGYCADLGAKGWHTSPTVNFSEAAIRRFYGGHQVPLWQAVSQCGRTF